MNTRLSLEDGLPLVQIWQTLSRNRWLIILTFVVFVIGGFILGRVLPPTYEARAQINIGEVADSGYFESPDSLIARLTAEYGLAEAEGAPFLKVAQLRKGTLSTIELVAEGSKLAAPRTFLENITKGILDSHQKIYDRGVAALTAQLKALDVNQQALTKAYAEASRLLDRNLGAPKTDPAQLTMLAMQRNQIGNTLIDLDNKRPDIISNLVPPRTHPTVLLGKIYAPKQPVAPKRALLLVAAAVLGLVFGILAAFGRDAVRAARSAGPAA